MAEEISMKFVLRHPEDRNRVIKGDQEPTEYRTMGVHWERIKHSGSARYIGCYVEYHKDIPHKRAWDVLMEHAWLAMQDPDAYDIEGEYDLEPAVKIDP